MAAFQNGANEIPRPADLNHTLRAINSAQAFCSLPFIRQFLIPDRRHNTELTLRTPKVNLTCSGDWGQMTAKENCQHNWGCQNCCQVCVYHSVAGIIEEKLYNSREKW